VTTTAPAGINETAEADEDVPAYWMDTDINRGPWHFEGSLQWFGSQTSALIGIAVEEFARNFSSNLDTLGSIDSTAGINETAEADEDPAWWLDIDINRGPWHFDGALEYFGSQASATIEQAGEEFARNLSSNLEMLALLTSKQTRSQPEVTARGHLRGNSTTVTTTAPAGINETAGADEEPPQELFGSIDSSATFQATLGFSTFNCFEHSFHSKRECKKCCRSRGCQYIGNVAGSYWECRKRR
jgi:hypothetical protein